MKLKLHLFISFLVTLTLATYAQDKKIILPPNWYNLDLTADGYFGISTEKAYNELLNNKKPKQKVIVAVIDGGTDINHEDLNSVLWTNTKEIANNGIDDDGNGYIDDVHGWNFIGSKKGNLAYDNLEMVRQLRLLKPKYQSVINATPLDSAEKVEYKKYRRMIADFGKKYDDASSAFPFYILIKKVLDNAAANNHQKTPTMADIDSYKADDEMEEYVKKIIKKGARDEGSLEKFIKSIEKGNKEIDVMLKYNLNEKYDQRQELVGDDYTNATEKNYGNNDVTGPNADHGTHVSGIIAANRTNNLGINGIANNVSIMSIRVVPEGDERDKDVANGIRYAVDNGAKVINMSFGKAYGWNKKIVDDAVKYAEQKGVLLVHAAGNDNSNNDLNDNFPNKYFESPAAIAYANSHIKKEVPAFAPPKNNEQMQNNLPGTIRNVETFIDKPIPLDTAKYNLPHALNWIEVGASAYKNDDELKASFSNYGKYNVDVFAPGFMINSTLPGSKYEEFDGTSMAAPVVSGLAALILSYYPDLKPTQIREIIIKSVVKVSQKVKYKDEKGTTIKAHFADISVSGGIVNAYQALKLAETY